MNRILIANLLLLVAFVLVINCTEISKEAPQQYWQAVLGDLCQLSGANFPKATADPTRYVECVKQPVSINERTDLGIWLLRDCLPNYKFVASARKCIKVASIRKSESLCNGPNASQYSFCPTQDKKFVVSETIQTPRQCACPNGESNCVCPMPEILTPHLVNDRSKRSPQNTFSLTINLPACPCNTQQASCACIDKENNNVQVFRDTCCNSPTQSPAQQNNQNACLCQDFTVSTTTTTKQPVVQNNNNCQTTTNGQQYCPQQNDNLYSQPQACPLVVGGVENAQYQGICSWMLDPLAVDPSSRTHFLQCQPAPRNLFCGRWQRMPCAPGTVFSAADQVCVWDTSATLTANDVGPLPSPQQQTTQSVNNNNNFVPQVPQNDCSCTGGVQVGQCNQNYQCPGQSICQVGSSKANPTENCKVCCYYNKKKFL